MQQTIARDQSARSSAQPPQKRWGIFLRKERWTLSWPGRLLAGSVVFVTLYLSASNAYSFLAVTHRVDTQILVVEGWIHEYAIRGAVEEFRRGSYRHLFSTGGPVTGSGHYVNDYQTSASVGADLLKNAGVPPESVQMVPSRVMDRDRTYGSAVALREWFREHNMAVQSVNVLTEDAHARRTRLLFEKALGKNVTVGIIAVPNPDYDGRRWWRYSDGVREVIGESIAYMYARFLFYPRASPRDKKMVEASQHPIDTQQ